MAEYNREILVPYLQDVCSLELLRQQIEMQICQLKTQIAREEQEGKWGDMPAPIEPELKDFDNPTCGEIVLFGSGILCLALMVLVLLVESDNPASMLMLVLAGFCFGLWFLWKVVRLPDVEQAYNAAMERYKKEQAKYDDQQARAFVALSIIDNHKSDLKCCQDYLARIMEVLNDTYSVNMIPMSYRNVYAAYYLYNYFSTSRATDLDQIIQTMVLEEIKAQLSTVIQQQSMMLLQQRAMMAKQDKLQQTVENNHTERMRALARMENNQELQTYYLQMIDRDVEVTNFFAAEVAFMQNA